MCTLCLDVFLIASKCQAGAAARRSGCARVSALRGAAPPGERVLLPRLGALTDYRLPVEAAPLPAGARVSLQPLELAVPWARASEHHRAPRVPQREPEGAPHPDAGTQGHQETQSRAGPTMARGDSLCTRCPQGLAVSIEAPASGV